MSNEFEFTENSAAHVVAGELASAQTKTIIDEGVAAGKTVMEVGHEVFGQMSQEEMEEFGKLVTVINLLIQMGTAFHFGTLKEQNDWEDGDRSTLRLRNHALFGYMAVCQHYVDSGPAKKWEAFFAEAETIGDVYRYFLQENNLTYDEASAIPGYAILEVEEILKTRLYRKGHVDFAINKAEWEALAKKHQEGMEDLECWEREEGNKPFSSKPRGK
jgi:hypothetical protein